MGRVLHRRAIGVRVPDRHELAVVVEDEAGKRHHHLGRRRPACRVGRLGPPGVRARKRRARPRQAGAASGADRVGPADTRSGLTVGHPVHLLRPSRLRLEPNPALVQQAEQRVQSIQNRIADRITAFAGSMPSAGSGSALRSTPTAC
jgi:hypothetical protein